MSRTHRPAYAVSVLVSLVTVVLGVLPSDPATAQVAAGQAVTVTVSPVAGSTALNRRVPVSGTVSDAASRQVLAHTAVELQVWTATGWATPPGAATLTDAGGRFTLSAPTFYYGRHTFRVVLSSSGRTGTAVASASRTLDVGLPYRPAGRAAAGRTDGARYDPCSPIPYRINVAGAPRNARALVGAALARARAATGLTFVYAGSYAGVPFSRQRDGGLPASGIGFAWSTARQVSGLAGSSIGLGGGGWAEGSRRTSSGVVIDRAFHYRPGWTGPNSIGGLLLHEIGHALGLEHVQDRRQVMYPLDIGAPHGDYNRGDLSALRRVGLDAGCL